MGTHEDEMWYQDQKIRMESTMNDNKYEIIHLKTLPPYFAALKTGEKTFEVVDDRLFQVGDRLVMHEWSKDLGFTGEKLYRRVTYILREYKGLASGFVVLGLAVDTRGEPDDQTKIQAMIAEGQVLIEARYAISVERFKKLKARARARATTKREVKES